MWFFPTPLFLSDRKGISVGLQDASLRHVPTAMSLLGYSLMSDPVSGHSCSDNNISGLIRLWFQMADSMSTSQRMIHTVYGKQVYLIRMTDRLTTRANILSDALRLVDKTFRAWQTEFRAFAKTAQCHHDASLEFLSKYTTEINRAFTSLLRLQELDDFVRQAEKIGTLRSDDGTVWRRRSRPKGTGTTTSFCRLSSYVTQQWFSGRRSVLLARNTKHNSRSRVVFVYRPVTFYLSNCSF